MWKHVRVGVLFGGVAIPLGFLIAAQILKSTVMIESRNDFLILFNALKVTFWPSSILEMFDPTGETNWKLIGLASLVNAFFYGGLSGLFMCLHGSMGKQLVFWSVVVLLAGCASWLLAYALWPTLIVIGIAATHMAFMATRRNIR